MTARSSTDHPGTGQDYDELLTRSLRTIKRLTAELEERRRHVEPIAVLGLSCRMPGGADDPESFWTLLREGQDAVVEVDAARWDPSTIYQAGDPAPGRTYTKYAGFLRGDVSLFDAQFFGLSPHEAAEMDPQQRLLLEVSWEALERSGIAPDGLRGSRTGVFVGQIGSEYATLPRLGDEANPYVLTGSMANIASGRISYVLGLQGPSLSIDTACSSSLVAVHLACESLQRGESDLALAAGVNLLVTADGFISLSSMRALSKDGRCHTFDAAGDGYGRGEGCGVVVLKRLSHAIRDGDPISAVIRASGVNHDGAGSGLTVPNGAAQRSLLSSTLERAGLRPADVGYFEAHGTGTALGDPIEFRAISEVYGRDPERRDPLRIGSVKSNIGHLEAAAGVAGLIKTVLSLNAQELPPTLHLTEVNPKIHLAELPAEVPRSTTSWPSGGRERIAAISSFGFSGTNGHLLVAEPPPHTAPARGAGEVPGALPVHVLPLSARSPAALDELVARYLAVLATDHATPAVADLCHTAAAGRSHFRHRLAVVASDREGLHAALSARQHRGHPEPPRQAPKLLTILSGNEDPATAAALLAGAPAFRAAVDRCDAAVIESGDTVSPRASWCRASPESAGTRDRARASFTFQYALAALWSSWGARPRAVVGAGTGELVAAHLAGVLSLEDALALTLGADPDGISLTVPECRLHSAATGGAVDGTIARNAAHWRRIQELVSSPPALTDVAAAAAADHHVAVAVGAVATPVSGLTLVGLPDPARADEPWQALASGLAALYEAGAALRWGAVDPRPHKQRVLLPTYPFQRRPYWTTVAAPAMAPLKASARPEATGPASPDSVAHAASLTGTVIDSPLRVRQVEYALDLDTVPDVRATHGVLHAGHLWELVARSAPGGDVAGGDITFHTALMIPEETTRRIMLIWEDSTRFGIHARRETGDWTLHAGGTVHRARAKDTAERLDLAALCSRTTPRWTGPEFYAEIARTRRLELGDGVRWLDEIRTGPDEALARLKPPAGARSSSGHAVGVHPGFLDACAQLAHAALPSSVPPDMRFMVTEWRALVLPVSAAPSDLSCHATTLDFDPRSNELRGAFCIVDEYGTVLGGVAETVMKGITPEHEKAFAAITRPESPNPVDEQNEHRPALDEIAQHPAAERPRALSAYLRRCFAELLKMPLDDLDEQEPLAELGLDSLVGVTGQHRIETDLGVSLPLESVLAGPSVADLTDEVLPRLIVPEAPAATPSASTAAKPRNPWIAHRTPRPAARLKLFCIPYGRGRGASVYRGWHDLVPDDIEVCPIQLPGKESRLRERPIDDLDEAVRAMAEGLRPELDRPYAFYGHSVGGLLAFRLAVHLREHAARAPEHLFVGAYTAPTVHPNPMVALTERLFADAGFDDIPSLARLAAADDTERTAIQEVISSEADHSDGLARALMPSRLAELKLVQGYRYDRRRTDIPITAFHGLRDDRVEEAHMAAWSQITDGPFALHLLSGDHLFLSDDQDRDLIIRHIVRELT